MGEPTRPAGAIAARYANALIEAGETSRGLEILERDLSDLDAALTHSEDLQAFIANPVIGVKQQMAVVERIVAHAKAGDLAANFLRLLVKNRRLPALPAILRTFAREMARRRGETPVSVRAAQVLTDAQTRALKDSLSKTLGGKVTLDVSVDRDLLGGMVVTVGSLMIDDSVRRKLERLSASLLSSGAQTA